MSDCITTNKVSTPHGRAVPVELRPHGSPGRYHGNGFNPSWESRPCGTRKIMTSYLATRNGFNPSWESRPCGTILVVSVLNWQKTTRFQPLMGEPSLWNESVQLLARVGLCCFNPSWESRPCGTSRKCQELKLPFGFNPSWESRPCGTCRFKLLRVSVISRFQPLMGEPSLWN